MKKIIIACLLIVGSILGLFGGIYAKNIDDAVNSYAQTYVANLVVKTIYETISQYLKDRGIEYFDIVHIDKDQTGNVKYLTVNSGLLNMIKAETTLLLAKKLDELQSKIFYIPIGNILGSRYFSGVGPNLKIKIVPLGYVSSETKNEFISVGINQSKHNISIGYSISLNVVAPFSSASLVHTSLITIAESIIVGDVPNTNITVGSGFNESIKYYVGYWLFLITSKESIEAADEADNDILLFLP